MPDYCRFCRQTVDDPCSKPTEAAMRCEIDASAFLNKPLPPTPTSLAAKNDYDKMADFKSLQEVTTAGPQMQMQPIMAMAPTASSFVQPKIPELPISQSNGFYFDEKVRELMLEVAVNDLQEETINKLWEEAKKVADEYEIVMTPTLKRKPKPE